MSVFTFYCSSIKRDMKLYNKSKSTAWDKYYKGDKVRRRYEEQQKEDYTS